MLEFGEELCKNHGLGRCLKNSFGIFGGLKLKVYSGPEAVSCQRHGSDDQE